MKEESGALSERTILSDTSPHHLQVSHTHLPFPFRDTNCLYNFTAIFHHAVDLNFEEMGFYFLNPET